MTQIRTQIRPQMRMRKALLKTVALTATALWLTACSSSPPVRFYSLAAPDASVQTAASVSTAIFIDLGPVGVPERLTRPQLVVQKGDRMEILEQDRWTSSFNNELHDTLANGIAAQLGAVDVKHGGRPAGQAVYRIAVDLRQFDAIGGDRVNAAFGWTVTRSDDGRAASCQAAYSVPVRIGGTEALVTAMQKTVAMAGTAIAATVNDIRSGAAASCGS